MAETRSHPFRGFLDMMSEMDRMRSLGRTGIESGQQAGGRTQAAAWVPTIDVVARGRDLVISAEIAGVPPKDIDVNVSNGVLTISGERPGELDAETVTPYVRERYYGHFRRSMTLPDGVDERKISASFDNGVVKITVPDAADTAAAPTPHHIPIAEG
ncbi:MAG: Hsp20/alpha crystallin family protein [Nocardioidaceae bacterium]|nr:Hsp20/alpha crystallin family protein [Nocardioidaceae bacterium]